MASSSIAPNDTRHLIRTTAPMKDAVGLLRLRLTRVDAKPDRSPLGLGRKNEEESRLERQWSVKNWSKRLQDASKDNFLNTPAKPATTTSTLTENYKLAPPSHRDKRRRRRRHGKSVVDLVLGKRRSLSSESPAASADEKAVHSRGDRKKNDDSSSCDEGQPRLLIHDSDASPHHSEDDAGDSAFTPSSTEGTDEEEEEFEIPVGGIIEIPKSKYFTKSLPSHNKDQRTRIESERRHSAKAETEQMTATESDCASSMTKHGNGVVETLANARRNYAATPETTAANPAAPRARMKITPARVSDALVQSEENAHICNSQPTHKAAPANINRHFLSSSAKSKSGLAPVQAGDGSIRKPPPLILSSAQRLISIESPRAPEMATACATSITKEPGVPENDTFEACEKDSAESEAIRARTLVRTLPHRHGADCERKIVKVEQKFIGHPSNSNAAGDKMISEIGTNGEVRDIDPNLVCKTVSEDVDEGFCDRNSGGLCVSESAGVDRPECTSMFNSNGADSIANDLERGPHENYSDGNNRPVKTVCSLDGDHYPSTVHHHDGNFPNTTSTTPISISSKPVDSVGDHSPFMSPVNRSQSTATNAGGPSLGTAEEDYRYSMSRRLSNRGMRRRGGASFRARFPAPYHNQSNGAFNRPNSPAMPWNFATHVRSSTYNESHDCPTSLSLNRVQEEAAKVLTSTDVTLSPPKMLLMKMPSTAAEVGGAGAVVAPHHDSSLPFSSPQLPLTKDVLGTSLATSTSDYAPMLSIFSVASDQMQNTHPLHNASTDKRGSPSFGDRHSGHSPQRLQSSLKDSTLTIALTPMASTPIPSTLNLPADASEAGKETERVETGQSSSSSLAYRSTTGIQTTQTGEAINSTAGDSARLMTAGGRPEGTKSKENSLLATSAAATATAVAIGGTPVSCDAPRTLLCPTERIAAPGASIFGQALLDDQCCRVGLARVMPFAGQHPCQNANQYSKINQGQSYPYQNYIRYTSAPTADSMSTAQQQHCGRDSHATLPLNSLSAESVLKRSRSGSSSFSGAGNSGSQPVHVEVAVVEAPVVFGAGRAFGSPSATPAVNEDERVIERFAAATKAAQESQLAVKAPEPAAAILAQVPVHSLSVIQKNLAIDADQANRMPRPPFGFAELKVPSTPNALLPPLSPTEAAARGSSCQVQSQRMSPEASSSPSSSTTTADQQTLLASSTLGGQGKRRGSISSNMQPPKKRFMHSMEDTSSSAILVLEEQTSPTGSAKSGHSDFRNIGYGPGIAGSPGQQSPITAQKPSPPQTMLHIRDARLAAMRLPFITKMEPIEHQHEFSIPNEFGQHLHHSAFARHAAASLNAILASQQRLQAQNQHPNSSGGSEINYPVPSTTQAHIGLSASYPGGLIKSRRSNSTETIAAFDIPPYLYQQHLQIAGAATGVPLPSTSASLTGGCLTNGMRAPKAGGIQNRSAIDPAGLYPLPTVPNSQSGAPGSNNKWPSPPIGNLMPAGLSGLMPLLRPPSTLATTTAGATATNAAGSTDSNAAANTNAGLNQYNLMQEIKNLPQGEHFHIALNNWEWCTIDHVRLPAIYRSGEKFVAVNMVQMRLLAKFPPNVPGEIMRRHTMVSHKMNVMEAWIFNTVNATECKYDFGYQLFTPNDEVVKLADVERFYWAVKGFNLTRMADLYRSEIRVAASLHLILTAHISSLKGQAELDSRGVQNMMSTFQAQAAAAATVASAVGAAGAGKAPSAQQSQHPPQPAPAHPPAPPIQIPQHRHSAAAVAAAGRGSNLLSPPPNFINTGLCQVPRGGSMVPGVTAAGLFATGSGYHPTSAGAAAAAAHAAAQQAAAYEAALAQGLLAHSSTYAAAVAAAAQQPPHYPGAGMPPLQHHLSHNHLLAAAQYGGALSPTAAAAAVAAGLPLGRAGIDAQTLRLPFGPRHGGAIPRF